MGNKLKIIPTNGYSEIKIRQNGKNENKL